MPRVTRRSPDNFAPRSRLLRLAVVAACFGTGGGRASAQDDDIFMDDGGGQGAGDDIFGNGGDKGDPKDDPFGDSSGEGSAVMLDPFSQAAPASNGAAPKNAAKPPKNAAPVNGAPLTEIPANPVNATPINGNLLNPAKNAAPVNGAPVNGGAKNGNAVPKNAVPVNGAPTNGAPVQGAAVNGVPGNAAPANAAPVNGAPVNGAPVNGVPKNAAPADAAPAEPPWAPVKPRPLVPRAKQPYSRIGEDALKATQTKPHFGVMGLAWGKSPADARAILAPKLQLLSEKASSDEPYHTIDQRYAGAFAGLPTADIYLRFYKGQFFYMMIALDTTEAGSATKVFQQVRRRMRKFYGSGRGYTKPIKLASRKALLEHIPLEGDAKKNGLPMLWNDQKEQNPFATRRLHDHYIRSHFWDPFEGWRFPNKVVIQTFVHEQFYADRKDSTLKPIWIFAKKDVFDLWKREIVAGTVVAPRDF